ncbi:hypothetical protein PR048_007905 [Dryococelus australis]|uniref:Uncharacterized protein n=1 Tax=Dryococelus australis TaxID=614101 RepID=A0ABQ9HWH5_9NEOP|nr:hypothetical protein PR048_007905 [Dryococelus australis]
MSASVRWGMKDKMSYRLLQFCRQEGGCLHYKSYSLPPELLSVASYRFLALVAILVGKNEMLDARSAVSEPGSTPDGVATNLRMWGIVPDDTASLRVFSGISHFVPPFNSGSAPYSPRFVFAGSHDFDHCLNVKGERAIFAGEEIYSSRKDEVSDIGVTAWNGAPACGIGRPDKQNILTAARALRVDTSAYNENHMTASYGALERPQGLHLISSVLGGAGKQIEPARVN